MVTTHIQKEFVTGGGTENDPPIFIGSENPRVPYAYGLIAENGKIWEPETVSMGTFTPSSNARYDPEGKIALFSGYSRNWTYYTTIYQPGMWTITVPVNWNNDVVPALVGKRVLFFLTREAYTAGVRVLEKGVSSTPEVLLAGITEVVWLKEALYIQNRLVLLGEHRVTGNKWVYFSSSSDIFNFTIPGSITADSPFKIELNINISSLRFIDGRLYGISPDGIYQINSNYGFFTGLVGGFTPAILANLLGYNDLIITDRQIFGRAYNSASSRIIDNILIQSGERRTITLPTTCQAIFRHGNTIRIDTPYNFQNYNHSLILAADGVSWNMLQPASEYAQGGVDGTDIYIQYTGQITGRKTGNIKETATSGGWVILLGPFINQLGKKIRPVKIKVICYSKKDGNKNKGMLAEVFNEKQISTAVQLRPEEDSYTTVTGNLESSMSTKVWVKIYSQESGGANDDHGAPSLIAIDFEVED